MDKYTPEQWEQAHDEQLLSVLPPVYRAAPELLEVLKEARSFMDAVAITDPSGDPFNEDDEESKGLIELKRRADAAITKATRESEIV